MAWDGNGQFSRTNGTQTGSTTWANARDAGNNITASQHDTHDQDLADGINACLAKNGENGATGSIKPATDAAYDLGSSTKQWRHAYLSGALISSGFLLAANLALSASVAGNALTIALKGRNGSDPSATNPVAAPFRNATVATGDFSMLNITAASSLVISSSSTMGARDGIPFRLWIVGFNDGGTWRIGAINCVSTAAGAGAGSDVTSIYKLAAWGIASSTAEGGAGGADSAQVIYTGTAVTSKAFVVLGYMTWESGLTTAGTWDAAPTRIQLFGPGVPLPGQEVQIQRTDTGAVATGTTTVPVDDTIPQNTEGDQYMSQAITPTSAANALRVRAQGFFTNSAGSGGAAITSLFQDSTANALKTSEIDYFGNNAIVSPKIEAQILAATTSSTTLKVRSGCNNAGTTTFNGASAGTRRYGGVFNSYLEVAEVMG